MSMDIENRNCYSKCNRFDKILESHKTRKMLRTHSIRKRRSIPVNLFPSIAIHIISCMQ